MSKPTRRETARDQAPVEHRLARVLETQDLAQIVPHLAPETLHQLIQYRGLEACVEVVTAATPAQLTSLLDLDLWRHARPGRDEQFDAGRFGEWLETLVEAGDAVAARTVAALGEPLVIAGLSRYVRVFDPGTFEPTASSDDEAIDRHDLMNSETSRNVPECEIGGYLLRARRTDAWDAIVALLVALEADHDQYFHAIMRGCRQLSNSTPEIDGLDDLLLAPEQHLHDVSIERERRRTQQGYATPAEARAFLQMARHSQPTYAFLPAEVPQDVNDAAAPADNDISTSIASVVELLTEAGVAPQPPRALLAAADENPRSERLPVLKRLMEFLLHVDENAYLTRSRELAFLANTLVAGCSVQSRPFTPREASDAAACICNLGLENWRDAPPDDGLLVDHDLVAAFAAGWSVLHREVSLFAADQLIATLNDLHHADIDTRRELRALQRALVKQRDPGTPWLARDAADVLAMLDTTAWIAVLGLLDECPVVPEALTAIVEGRTTPVSATAFEFIASNAQIGDVRLFMRMLPAVLSR